MSIDRKVQEALAAGVPMKEIQKVLGNNAMKARDRNTRAQLMNAGGAVYKQIGGQLRNNAAAARNAKVGGSLIQGGLKGIGTAQSNLAQGIGQAGLNNRSFSPTQSALSPIGDAAAARGEAEAQYQKDLSGIAQGEQARADRLAKEEAASAAASEKEGLEAKDKRQIYLDQVDLAKQAILELGKGAAKVINFAVSPKVTKVIKASTLGATRVSGLKEGVNLSALEADLMVDAINAYWGAQSPELNSYYRMRQLANELRVIARKKIAGQGQVTEGEADVVYNTVFGFDQPADSVASNLKSLMGRAAKQAMITTPNVPYTSTPAFTIDVTAEDLGLPSLIDKANEAKDVASEKISDIQGAVTDKVDTVKETVESAVDKVKSIAGVKGSGTQEDPYKVPVGRITKKSVLNWLEDKDLPDDSYVTWKKISGTVEQLVEYLTKEK